jgi:pimeloyl-ACP methyl ester carboxylesterase
MLSLALVLVGCGDATDPATQASLRESSAQPPSAVVVVPGYGGNPASVATLVSTLAAAGHRVTTVSLPGDGTGNIEAMVPALAQSVQQLTATGVPVDVVGYSMGGLVARAWARQAGGASQARRIVTVGTPNNGTKTAALGQLVGTCPEACQQMVPGSDFLKGLNAGDPTPEGPAWITLRSADDDVVRPADTVVVDGASNVLLQAICPDVSVDHSGLVSDPLPLAVVVRAVSQAPWSPPKSSQCAALSRP